VSDETPEGSGPTDPEHGSEHETDQSAAHDDGGPRARARSTAVDMPRPTGSARVFASTIDLVLAGVFVYVLLGVLASMLGLLPGRKLTASEQRSADLLYLVVLFGTALIFVLLERSGGSVGKRLSGLRTAGLNGVYPAPWAALLVKYLLIFALQLFGFIGAILVMAGLMFPFWRPDRRNVFDLLARLQVVPKAAVLGGGAGSAGTGEAPSATADAAGD